MHLVIDPLTGIEPTFRELKPALSVPHPISNIALIVALGPLEHIDKIDFRTVRPTLHNGPPLRFPLNSPLRSPLKQVLLSVPLSAPLMPLSVPLSFSLIPLSAALRHILIPLVPSVKSIDSLISCLPWERERGCSWWFLRDFYIHFVSIHSSHFIYLIYFLFFFFFVFVFFFVFLWGVKGWRGVVHDFVYVTVKLLEGVSVWGFVLWTALQRGFLWLRGGWVHCGCVWVVVEVFFALNFIFLSIPISIPISIAIAISIIMMLVIVKVLRITVIIVNWLNSPMNNFFGHRNIF